MAGHPLLPDVPTLLRHIDQGMTQRQIGDMYGTTRQAVGLKLRGVLEPRARRREWPWIVESRHKSGWLYLAISIYTVALTKERPLRKQETHTLGSFMKMMEDLDGDYVVDYYKDTAVGFQLRRRIPGHDDPDSLIGNPRPQAGAA